jgi:hypothetical protein
MKEFEGKKTKPQNHFQSQASIKTQTQLKGKKK